MKFVHLTDLHVTEPDTQLFGQSPNLVLERAIETIARDHGDAELCVITGDITHNGTVAEYQQAAKKFRELPMPCVATIGNHDERDAAIAELPGIVCTDGGFAQGVVETSEGVFILLDTKTEGTHAGGFCLARARWLRAALDDAAGRPVWLFMHHPPMPLGMPAMDEIAMDADSAARFAETLHADDKIRHLLFGHYHRPVSGAWQGIPFSSHRSMMLQCALDLKGDTHVHGIFEEPQYAVVLVRDGMTLVHYHDFDSAAGPVSMGAPED